MPWPSTPLPPDLAARPFTVAGGAQRGLTRARLARVPAPWHGLRAPRPAQDLIGRCRELAMLLPPGAAFSHATGWGLWDVDLPRGLHRPADLHVLVGAGTTPPRRPGVVGHRTTRVTGTVDRYGVPVLPVESIWVQLAQELDVTELVVAGDALLRRNLQRSSLDALRAGVGRLPAGTRGRRRLGLALDALRAGTDSCMETRLRLVVVRAGLPCPEVNRPVRGRAGRLVAVPDLSYPALRIAIEYDGDIHRVDRATWRRDVTRRRSLEALGWRVISCTADDVRDPRLVIAAIRHAITESARMHAS